MRRRGHRADQPGASLLAPLARPWAVLLTTRKRDGTRVGTPVNFVVDGTRAFFGTPATTGKAKRLRHTATVEIAPCTPRGRPTGPGLSAQARLLDGPEAAAALRRLRRRHPIFYGLVVPLELRLKGTRGLYYEVTLSGPAPDGSSPVP